MIAHLPGGRMRTHVLAPRFGGVLRLIERKVPEFGSGDHHLDPRAGFDLAERLHVAERIGENVDGAREPDLVATADRGAAEPDGDRRALRPISDLTGSHHGAGIGLARDPHRYVEIDLLAPGE